MGNKVTRTTQASTSEYHLHDLPSSYNLVFKEVLGRGRFFKSILCKHDEGFVLVKVYFKRGDPLDLKVSRSMKRVWQKLERFSLLCSIHMSGLSNCSTIGAIIMTPLLTKLLAGQLVPVDAAGLALSTFQVVLVPTIVGVLLNEYFPKFTSKIITLTPLIGVILTTLLCASPIGQVAEVLKTQGAQLILPVAALHVAAFAIGYWISRFSTFGESTSRTISIECGMQSSALGFLLAQKHFTNPLVAVPSAVSVVCMALGGSALAVFWRNKPIQADDKDDFKE